jgi:signal peptidase II
LKKSLLVFLVVLFILIIDQWLKVHIKTTLSYGGGFDILGLSWAKIHFVENEGMAFGMQFGGEYGKLILSLFRLIMIGFLIYLVNRIIKAGGGYSLLVSFSLILAGAIGNMIDSAFYGLIFSESPKYHPFVAELFPEGGGYGTFLHGKVVDMFYFPMIDTYLPDWVPFWGGERFQFFQPVFNIADSAISVGTVSLLLFHRSFFANEDKKKEIENPEAQIQAIESTEPGKEERPETES